MDDRWFLIHAADKAVIRLWIDHRANASSVMQEDHAIAWMVARHDDTLGVVRWEAQGSSEPTINLQVRGNEVWHIWPGFLRVAALDEMMRHTTHFYDESDVVAILRRHDGFHKLPPSHPRTLIYLARLLEALTHHEPEGSPTLHEVMMRRLSGVMDRSLKTYSELFNS